MHVFAIQYHPGVGRESRETQQCSLSMWQLWLRLSRICPDTDELEKSAVPLQALVESTVVILTTRSDRIGTFVAFVPIRATRWPVDRNNCDEENGDFVLS